VGKENVVMFDTATPKGRILTAALQCAAAKSWEDVTLLDIAEAAGVQLGELRQAFESKTRVIAAVVRSVDDEVLKRTLRRAEGQEARDVLFDVIMTRFDVLAPHKSALKSIHAAGAADLGMARPILASMHWMLQAAGIDTEGHTGRMRVLGLATVYASVFRVWLEDDDPGHSRTMAALDRRLRQGERTIRGVEQAGAVLHRLATDGPAFLRSVLRGRPSPRAEPKPGPDAEHV
jgi:AcrR family transcriptional regulator